MAQITRVEVHVFGYEVPDLELPAHGAAGVGNLVFRKGGRLPCTRCAVTIDSGDGARGEYVTHWVGTPASLAQTLMLAPHLLGPRPGRARGDLRRPQARGPRLRPHGPRPARHRACGTSPASAAALRWPACSAGSARGCRPTPAPTMGRIERRPGLASGLRRLRAGLQGAGLRRLQDPRLARRRRPRARPPTCWACAQAVGDGWPLDARPGLRAAHLDGRAVCRPRLRRGRLFLVRGPLPRQRGVGHRRTSACARS